MSRRDRRAVASEMRKQRAAWPKELEPMPESEWPPVRPERPVRPLEVWRSRDYLAQVYPETPQYGSAMRRLTVCRVTIGSDGHWHADIPWDDLQRCKRETGYGDWYGVEIYPRERDLVHLANMRHVWLLSAPLAIGWFGGRQTAGEPVAI